MLILHSVSKELGRGKDRKLVLNDVSCAFPRNARIVILGQRGAGKSTLVSLLNGSGVPTRGWIERRGSISPNRLGRISSRTVTPRRVATRLSRLYRIAAEDVIEFAVRFGDLQGVMDVPMGALPKSVQEHVRLALIYSIPFDFYVFDNSIGPKKGPLAARCRQALEMRNEQSTVILTTSNPRVAREFNAITAILYNGKLKFFDTAEEALAIFRRLPKQRSARFSQLSGTEDTFPEEEELI